MIVDLNPTEDQQLIVESIGGMLADRLPVSRLREKHSHAGAAEAALRAEFAHMGLFGMGISTDDGGAGYGLCEEVLVAREMGKVLASPSLIAQILAGHLAESALRDALIAGEASAAFAAVGLSGELYLYDGEAATHVVVLSEAPELVAKDAFAWAASQSIDESIAVSQAVPPSPDKTPRSIVADRISLLLSAALSGMAQSACDLAVDYAMTREQFGQPIGSFQAIKHSLADMRVRADAADAQSRVAATIFGRGENDRREIAAARWLAGDAAITNAKAGIQVHGGMGFTAECDAHFFLKRAHILATLGSTKRNEERRLIAPAARA